MKTSFSRAELRLAELLAGRIEDPRDEDLETLEATASEFSLGGALLRRLERRGAVAEPLRARLEPARDVAAGRNLWLAHAAEQLSKALDEAHVVHRVVKGAALLPWLAHPGDRWLVDADLLFTRDARAWVAAHLTELGLTYRAHVRHDGRPSRAARDGSSLRVLGAYGAPLDLHFTARPLPEAQPASAHVTLGALAAGLSDHVLTHHAPSAHLLLRHVADLRTLLDAGGLESLLEAQRSSAPLARSLAWMAALGAPDLVGVVPARALRLGVAPWLRVSLAIKRVRELSRDGVLLHALYPAPAYLDAHHGTRSRWSRLRRLFDV
ncbi:MAG: nucleotidyltransferase family protein [Sandaracinaceae bacterium]|nr:nucleotidyltransferase family protein [Sandaracinaceae bacterium]